MRWTDLGLKYDGLSCTVIPAWNKREQIYTGSPSHLPACKVPLAQVAAAWNHLPEQLKTATMALPGIPSRAGRCSHSRAVHGCVYLGGMPRPPLPGHACPRGLRPAQAGRLWAYHPTRRGATSNRELL